MMSLRPIIVDKNRLIIGGNMRYRALIELGYTDVPVEWVKSTNGMTPEGIREFVIKDNLAFGEWDFDLLANDYDMNELIEMGMDESLLDVDLWNKETDAEKLDDVPEPQKDAISKLGDIFVIDGKHRVMCGDSTLKADVEVLMAGKRADMVFTDPPYGINVVGKNGSIGKGVLAKEGKYRSVIGDDVDYEPAHLFELCKNVFVFGANYYAEKLPLKLGRWSIWDKNRPSGTTFSDCEICWSSKKGTYVKKYSCTWVGMIKEGESGKREHPTQKPIKLLSDILNDYKDWGLLIVDLYLGSGSTLIASEQTNRICYGMELDPIYIDVILKRYKNLYPTADFKCENREFDFNELFIEKE